MVTDEQIEKLAEIEHEQWAHWTTYFLKELTPESMKRWIKQIETPYSELSEPEKEADRKWARKLIPILSAALQQGIDAMEYATQFQIAAAIQEERERCAGIAGRIARYVEQGAGECNIGERLRQVERLIIEGSHN